MRFEKEIVIDCKAHLLGRLASIVAKQLLSGQKITLVRTEETNITGPFFRSKLRFMSFMRKRCLVNPSHGTILFLADLFFQVLSISVLHLVSFTEPFVV